MDSVRKFVVLNLNLTVTIFFRITVDGDDFGSKKTYIATQGCLPSTRADFWQMVWQVKSPSNFRFISNDSFNWENS